MIHGLWVMMIESVIAAGNLKRFAVSRKKLKFETSEDNPGSSPLEPVDLRELLEQVQQGNLGIEEALERLA